jgi:reverse transcriptase-like protein
VVGSKWVFCIKCGPDGTIQKYKACVVAQGFTQIENINYNETFAPVAKFTLLHTILAIAAKEDLVSPTGNGVVDSCSSSSGVLVR